MKKETKSYLIMEKTDFAQKINGQIVIGKELLSQQITTAEAFDKFKLEISKWSDYNLELLKQSFDNPDNEYRKDYKSSHFIGGYVGSHSLYEDVERKKKEVSSYIKGLEKILNKLDVIPQKGIV
jgi:hypothetical protein